MRSMEALALPFGPGRLCSCYSSAILFSSGCRCSRRVRVSCGAALCVRCAALIEPHSQTHTHPLCVQMIVSGEMPVLKHSIVALVPQHFRTFPPIPLTLL